MNVQKRNDVSIYCLSSGPTLPEWLGERARRNLSKKDENVRRRIELIQDFQMPSSSTKLVQSTDGRYIFAAGTYPPRIRCYDVHDLSLKFERYMDAEVVDMVMLSEDYGKIAILLENRYVAFHAPYGAHEAIRIPTFGRAMAYEPTSCELLLAAKGNQVYRLNLEEGRFSEPWTFEPSGSSASCITVHQSQPLATVGCDDGIVRFWDNRSPDSLLRPFLKLDVQSATKGYGFADENPFQGNTAEITSIAHDPSGLYMAVGTAGGLVALYDVRSSRPLHIKEHKHGLPVHTVKFHSGSGMVLSADEKLVKVWRYKSSGDTMGLSAPGGAETEMNDTSLGAVKVNVEGTGKLSHFIVAGDENDPHGDRSGVILCATDRPQMESYFIPAVGVAPKWCSYLENITEELEERDLNRDGTNAAGDLVRDGQESIYENYKFVSRDDLEKLGLSNLIGTPLLRGYMHGFFMHTNLYNRVKAVANPFEYEDYQKKKLKERLDAKQSSRIAPRASEKKTKAAVNPELADRLQLKAADPTRAGSKAAGDVLSDGRFGDLFTNPDYLINQDDEIFKLRNPSGVAAAKRKKDNLDSDEEDDDEEIDVAADVPDDEEGFEHGDDSDDAEETDDDDDSESEEEDGFQGGKVRGEAYEEMKALKSETKKRKPLPKKATKTTKKKPVMLEADDSAVNLGLGDTSASDRARRRTKEMNMPLAKRFALEKDEDKVQVRVARGSKEATFIPRDTKRKMEAEAKKKEESNQERGKRNRRGIKELGFKTPFRNVDK
jgi:ribosome biogenesis protein ENP2